MRFVRTGMFVMAVALGAGFAIAAPATTDSAARKELKRADLSGAPGMEVIASISELKPGDEFPRHLHHGVEAGYVVQGGMIQVPGMPPSELKTGSPIFNLRDAPHAGYKVIGPGNIILFTTHVVDKGKPLYDWTK